MAQQGVITLNTKAYNPRGKSGDVATWALVGDTSFGGATSLVTESVRGPSKDGIYRVRFTLAVPKAAAEDSSCACVGQELGSGHADIQIRMPTAFTSAERQDFADRVQGLVANAIFDAAVAVLEPAW